LRDADVAGAGGDADAALAVRRSAAARCLGRNAPPLIGSCLTRFAPRVRLAAVSERGVDIYPSLLCFHGCRRLGHLALIRPGSSASRARARRSRSGVREPGDQVAEQGRLHQRRRPPARRRHLRDRPVKVPPVRGVHTRRLHLRVIPSARPLRVVGEDLPDNLFGSCCTASVPHPHQARPLPHRRRRRRQRLLPRGRAGQRARRAYRVIAPDYPAFGHSAVPGFHLFAPLMIFCV
jgi:hypothetical protein